MDTEIGKIKKLPEGYDAFIPHPFPPRGGFECPSETLQKNDKATRLLGKLDGITQLLPDIDFFLFMYIRKDAASSSQIEGTHADLIDAIEAEAKIDTHIPEDVDDILHYIRALNYGMKRMEKFPLSLRFVRELHRELMEDARVTNHPYPGEFRRTQNWIGGTTLKNASFVPPPVTEMKESLSDLERFIHSGDDMLTLIKAGLLHAQFETIHPFTDGNGRTGRMLVTFYLMKMELLEKPVLFLSSYFRKHQELYYQRLNGYHSGNVQAWIEFFLDGVIEIAEEASETVAQITRIRDRDTLKIQTLSKRSSESAVLVLPKLYQLPIVTTRNVREWTGFTRAGAQRVIDRFVELGILVPRAEESTLQSYIYKDYVEIFTN